MSTQRSFHAAIRHADRGYEAAFCAMAVDKAAVMRLGMKANAAAWLPSDRGWCP